MSDEQVFLHDGPVYVSSSRVVLFGTTHATASIASVSKRVTPVRRGCALSLVASAGLCLLLALTAAVSSDRNGALNVTVSSLIVAGITGAIGVLWLRAQKPRYHVFVSSGGSEREVLSSRDEAFVDRVIYAITAAIAYRG